MCVYSYAKYIPNGRYGQPRTVDTSENAVQKRLRRHNYLLRWISSGVHCRDARERDRVAEKHFRNFGFFAADISMSTSCLLKKALYAAGERHGIIVGLRPNGATNGREEYLEEQLKTVSLRLGERCHVAE